MNTRTIAAILFGIGLSLQGRINKMCYEKIAEFFFNERSFEENLSQLSGKDEKDVRIYSLIFVITNLFTLFGLIHYILTIIEIIRQV